MATGTRVLVLGDTKPDYTMLTEHLGGQVIRIGRGLDRINPLDAGPLGAALRRMSGPDAQALRWEVRSRRLSLLMALCTLVRGTAITNAEEVILGRAIDLLVERSPGGTADHHRRARCHGERPGHRALRRPHRHPRRVPGPGRRPGVHPRPAVHRHRWPGCSTAPPPGRSTSTHPRSASTSAGSAPPGDKLLTAAMLCTWAYGFGVVDAAAALADQGIAPRRSYMGVMDELWRALRGAPGLVEYADSLTRLNRAKGMSSVMITHSLADLDALATEEDRAKARGFIERSAITVMAGLPPRELARVHEITPLTGPEMELVTSWSAPDSWQPGARHPGRGKYLIKAGERLGIPVELSLVGAEYELYDTDQAIRARPAAGGRGEPGARAAAPARRRRTPRSPGCCSPPSGAWRLAWLAWAAARLAAAAGRRPGPAVRHAVGIGPGPARPHRAGVARRTPTPPGRRDRRRPGRCPGRRRGHRVADHRPAPQPARRPGRRAQPGPVRSASSPRPGGRAGHPAAALAGRRPARPPGSRRIGLLLGRLKQPGGDGPDLFASWEDTLLAFMGPRSGKTTAWASRTCCRRPARSWPPATRPTCGPPPPSCAPPPARASGCSTRSTSPPPGSAGGGTCWPR